MAIFNMIEENEATGKVKEVYEDIKKKRNVKFITNFWKMLANEPDTLERTWNSLQQVMKKGALDEMTKELVANIVLNLIALLQKNKELPKRCLPN